MNQGAVGFEQVKDFTEKKKYFKRTSMFVAFVLIIQKNRKERFTW